MCYTAANAGAGDSSSHFTDQKDGAAYRTTDQISDLLDDGTDDQCGKKAGGHAAESVDKNFVEPFF